MNKLLGKKKAAPEPLNTETLNALTSSPHTSPGLRMPSTSRWKKNKKQVEQKPSLDMQLPNALPPSDDFRTSLLMPNLSARFSMLREQDDPNSKLGKASDDSVLQPSRRSRMLDFGFSGSGLNDIAEVQSINSSIRPPFAMERSASEDGYGSEPDVSGHKTGAGGSIMSRARPGEGNTMFGGRQKVYKIPMAGGKPTGLGKAVYEDDIGMSAFQRWRQKDREAREARASDESTSESRPFEYDSHLKFLNDSAKDLSPALSWTSDPKRSTASSVARSDTRSSTAGTSVTSQGGATFNPSAATSPSQPPMLTSNLSQSKRTDTKGRRLYETGLDQHIYEQQTSAMTRLNSVQRGKTSQLPHLQTARSVGNMHERAMQTVYTSQQTAAPNFASASQQFPKRSGSNGPSPTFGSRPDSPSSVDRGQGLEADGLLALALEPADRGKATALGAFNKPAQKFDEQQYLERQQQLQRSQSRAGTGRDSAGSSVHQRVGRQELARDRSDSNVSTRSRSRSASANRPAGDSSKAYDMFQNASAQVAARTTGRDFDKPALPDPHRTFFGNISPSDSEDEEEDGPSSHPSYSYRGWQPNTLPSVSEHPALRRRSKASLAEEDEDNEVLRSQVPKVPTPLEPPKPFSSDMKGLDSPTLPPASNQALNGMVHHLRQRSNQSSIYPNDDDDSSFGADELRDSRNIGLVPRSLDLAQRRMHGNLDTDSGIGSSTTHSNPWDLDEIDTMGGHDREATPVSPVESTIPKGEATYQDHTQGQLRSDRQQVSPEPDALITPWQTEMRRQHFRDASSATQQERDAFASELAARRNAIQESMKSMVGDGQSSRNVSPARAPSSSAFKAFGKLKPKPSREQVADPRQGREVAAPAKAKHLLGLAANGSTSSLPSPVEKGNPRESSRSRENPGSFRTASESRDRSQPRDIQTTGLQRLLQPSDWVDSEVGTAVERSAAFLSASRPPTVRARSDSATAKGGASRGRTIDRGDGFVPHRPTPPFGQELTPRPSPEVGQSPFDGSGNDRANPRAIGNKAGSPMDVHSPPSSVARASPVASSISQSMTPPLSGASTPMSQSLASPPAGAQGQFMQQVPPQRPLGNSLRKKTISKSDISEPTLISSTSNVDTVDLPPGASLKNGIEDPPPLPPINPKRRAARKIFGMGRNDSSEDGTLPTRTSISPENNVGGRGRRSNSGNADPNGTLRSAASTPNFAYHQSPPQSRAGVAMGQTSPRRLASHGQPVNGGMF